MHVAKCVTIWTTLSRKPSRTKFERNVCTYGTFQVRHKTKCPLHEHRLTPFSISYVRFKIYVFSARYALWNTACTYGLGEAPTVRFGKVVFSFHRLLFRRVRKIAKTDYSLRHVRLSIRMERQLGSHWTDFNETWYLRLFRKSIAKIQVSLKSDKNNGYFTRRRFDIFDDISLNSSQNEKCFRQKL